MELKAIKRFHLFWRKAPAVPIKLDKKITINKKIKILLKKFSLIVKINLINKLKIPILGIIAKKEVTGLGQPSYTSGSQKWKGAAPNLNKKEVKIANILIVNPELKLGKKLYS